MVEIAAFASFVLLVAAWVALPLRTTTEPSGLAADAQPLAEPVAA